MVRPFFWTSVHQIDAQTLPALTTRIGAHLGARMICLDTVLESVHFESPQIFGRVRGSATYQVFMLDPFEIDHMQDQTDDSEEMCQIATDRNPLRKE